MREPVLGSRTLRTSRVRAATVGPMTPDLTTNDLGVLAAFGSAAESVGLICASNCGEGRGLGRDR